jgi:hypothetical protein
MPLRGEVSLGAMVDLPRRRLVAFGLALAVVAPGGALGTPYSADGRPARAENVRVFSFIAVRVKNTKRRVLVRWRTGGEPDVLGFRLTRVVGKKKTRVGGLISGRGPTGGSYSYGDLLPKTVKLACYTLDEVATTGAAARVGKTCMKKK